MSTQGIRGSQWRKNLLDLDLNSAPPIENRDQEGTSTQVEPYEAQANQVQEFALAPMIDVDAIDDDVVESSPRAFAEAKSNARRNHRRTIVDIDVDDMTWTCNRRRGRLPGNITNCDRFINLEISCGYTKKSAEPLPLKEPTFHCPICMGSLTEEMSTRCGHIFCKNCIKAAIKAQGKCPTCRKKVTVKELIRVFLPATG